ncbi:MAG: type II toxin-antitoxin system RelE/ParE family toxin [Candidatus Electrothrix sp. ATG1]|nr:type II toxin-antitoxin system RelE/ParE family toxin [Candidatus Electrothrix sp. ATG1]MCI5212057.1 type II toxin-antitoxin system RelE/ParE family toxin [Candidatus Electrothrix sp. ATG2]
MFTLCPLPTLLKGDLSGYYRFRIGNYRLFYPIEEDKVIIVVVDIQHRQNAYKETVSDQAPFPRYL